MRKTTSRTVVAIILAVILSSVFIACNPAQEGPSLPDADPSLIAIENAVELALTNTPMTEYEDVALQTCGPALHVVTGRTESGKGIVAWVGDEVVSYVFLDDGISSAKARGVTETLLPGSRATNALLVCPGTPDAGPSSDSDTRPMLRWEVEYRYADEISPRTHLVPFYPEELLREIDEAIALALIETPMTKVLHTRTQEVGPAYTVLWGEGPDWLDMEMVVWVERSVVGWISITGHGTFVTRDEAIAKTKDACPGCVPEEAYLARVPFSFLDQVSTNEGDTAKASGIVGSTIGNSTPSMTVCWVVNYAKEGGEEHGLHVVPLFGKEFGMPDRSAEYFGGVAIPRCTYLEFFGQKRGTDGWIASFHAAIGDLTYNVNPLEYVEALAEAPADLAYFLVGDLASEHYADLAALRRQLGRLRGEVTDAAVEVIDRAIRGLDNYEAVIEEIRKANLGS